MNPKYLGFMFFILYIDWAGIFLKSSGLHHKNLPRAQRQAKADGVLLHDGGESPF